MADNFTEYSDFPKVEWMRAGNKFIAVTLRQINGTTSSDRFRKTENVEEVTDAVKEYESVRQNITFSDTLDKLHDAYDNLMGYLQPYKRYEVEGQLERDNAGSYYLGGYNTPIPETMADLIVEHYENDLSIDHLVEFWKKMLLNPNERAREDLFQYIQDHGITITDNGYMVLYKAVTTKNRRVPDDDLAQFVGAKYLKRKNWGKNPKDYHVYNLPVMVTLPNNHTAGPGYYVSKMDLQEFSRSEDENGTVVVLNSENHFDNHVEYLGTLEELFNDRDKLSKEGETVMTDKHSHTFEYNLGETHSEDREKCNSDPSVSCGRGLHVGSYDYVSSFGHNPNRDIIQAVLVNPMHVVCLPKHDNSKIRTCEFFSYGIMERDDDGVWHELETQYFEEDYESMEEEALEERLEKLGNEPRTLTDKDDDMYEDQKKAAQERLVDLRN